MQKWFDRQLDYLICNHPSRLLFAIVACLIFITSVCTGLVIHHANSGQQREIALMRLDAKQNQIEIDAMKKTQDWMQHEIFVLRGRK